MGQSNGNAEPVDYADFLKRLNTLIDRYRVECLYDLKEAPDVDREIVARMVLRRLSSCADRDGYIEARRLLNWLSQTSSARSVG